MCAAQKFFDDESRFEYVAEQLRKIKSPQPKKDENHLYKHAMHLIRLYQTGIYILEGRGIQIYREKDLPLLPKIRSGEIPLDDVFKMADEYEEKFFDAYKNSTLSEIPDELKIDKLLIEIYSDCNKNFIAN